MCDTQDVDACLYKKGESKAVNITLETLLSMRINLYNGDGVVKKRAAQEELT